MVSKMFLDQLIVYYQGTAVLHEWNQKTSRIQTSVSDSRTQPTIQSRSIFSKSNRFNIEWTRAIFSGTRVANQVLSVRKKLCCFTFLTTVYPNLVSHSESIISISYYVEYSLKNIGTAHVNGNILFSLHTIKEPRTCLPDCCRTKAQIKVFRSKKPVFSRRSNR